MNMIIGNVHLLDIYAAGTQPFGNVGHDSRPARRSDDGNLFHGAVISGWFSEAATSATTALIMARVTWGRVMIWAMS